MDKIDPDDANTSNSAKERRGKATALQASIPADILEKAGDWKMVSCGIALAPFAGKTWEMKRPVPFKPALEWFANVSPYGMRHGYMAFQGGQKIYFESGKFESLAGANS